MVTKTATKTVKLLSAEAGMFDGSISPLSSYTNGASTIESILEASGVSPEKLILPKNYHAILKMCYDFYQRGGVASTVINRLTELTITDIRNGKRKTGEEANNYYDAILHRSPSRLMRFLRFACLEYFLSGMVLPEVTWVDVLGSELSPKLDVKKVYTVPKFDLYPPNLVHILWTGWGKKTYLLKIPPEDIKLIKEKGGIIKEQQLRYEMWRTNYPDFVTLVQEGSDSVEIVVDPIMRKEVTFVAYPTPFLYNALESLLYKQQLRRMDFAVASRVISAILLVQEGNDTYPLIEETKANLQNLKNQVMARAGNPKLMERLFILFSNHTTKMTWISPDVQAMLDQEKYKQTNDELAQSLGFARILITGESANAQASELSTWAIKPMMEEFRSMVLEWLFKVYEDAAEYNKFRNIPDPAFKPIQLQDFVKTAAVFAQAFKEGNISRSTRVENIGLNFETEQEAMMKEKPLIAELSKGGEFKDMPYNVQIAPGAGGFGGRPAGAPVGGRPQGSQNVAVNNRNRGVKPAGQKPLSKVSAEMVELLPDEEVVELINTIALERGIYVDKDKFEEISPEN